MLPEKLEIGKVTLLVSNLNKLKDFYSKAIGLEILSEKENEVTLGYGSNEIIKLVEDRSLSFASPKSTGLYHMAILFSSQSDLSRVIDTIIEEYSGYFHGSSDHIVSEAFYLEDPEGNGIELYYDKPKEQWEWKDGKVVMGSSYIDPSYYIKQHGIERDPMLTIKIGHIHLKVGNLETSKNFYVNKLGFDITESMPSALFVSKDRYHHHIGMNIWQSNGSGKMEKALGIESYEILIKEKLDNITNKFKESNIDFLESESSYIIEDPWGIKIIIKSL